MLTNKKYSGRKPLVVVIPLALMIILSLTGCKDAAGSGGVDTGPGFVAQVGWIAYNDGSVSASYDSKKKVVGIVIEVTAGKGATKILGVKDSNVAAWGPMETLTAAISETDAAANMAEIQKLENWETDYPAFKYCADYGTKVAKDGKDWYLPAKADWELVKKQIAAIADGMGLVEDLNNPLRPDPAEFPWSSTQYDKDNAWIFKVTNYNSYSIFEFEKEYSASMHVFPMRPFEQTQ